jgi:ABC-type sugar transport system substrate-binding protein
MKPLLLMLLVALAPSLARQTVFTVDCASQADVKVFVVEYESQAGWRNSAKKHLVY